MKPIRLMSGFFTVGIWTLLSRVMGFVRDVMIAGYLGSGPAAEAFLVAFSLPNMFRRFFAEGAFNMAFVPMFSKKLESGDDPEKFAQDAFVGMAFILTLFTIIGIVAMPGLVLLMASGFAGDERFDLAVEYGRLAFPYILFISLAALVSGVLNATGRFMAAAAAPVVLNVIFILAVLIGAALGRDGSEAIGMGIDKALGLQIGDTLALSVPLAGIAQLALVWWAAKRAGFTLTFGRRPRLTPELKRLAIIAAPAALAGGVMQINLLVGRQVASFYEGAVAWLNYADRLYQLPLGVVGIAIGVVLLPDLSRRLKAGDEQGSHTQISRAAEVSLALTIPSAVALMVIPFTLATVLFQRGATTTDDAAAIAIAVAIYGLGLPAFVLQKILQPLYYAREDTRRPFYFAVVAMVVNVVLAVGLSPVIGWIAPAIATTLAGWAMFALLAYGARGFGLAAKFDARFHKRIWRIMAAAAVMGGALWIGNLALQPLLAEAWWRGVALVILIALAAVSYFGTGQLIGAFKLAEFKRALKRG
ncbi:MAG: murein biosynthesis integral membrane protein MurJ [Roseobacter sp.]|jgi:putative peptidoglycan lipid II flippase|uniref:Probable lipid II flippase MurJ n=1 Tax=Sulfitobacter pontiacus TaxID=60137 RepID=A0AAX3ACU5_9RHOB|nr:MULTISPECIES: murein biosynthesis integral membrane protein MurJ [Sulfitobacter]MBG64520.1 murein biosynthesis integral membrane protein MurJ [Roseobacter sp.]NKX47863.1 murein biosynthesis integral membrane protein MurJ [Rhodobacteraceae bacterium R_SAG8]KAJ30720.1 virulence factor MviN [Sulfitobacter pontiacus 3SOLIMAR09]OAN80376.1 murein biosynthesis integral membrane protein MurJ [Sulfitobacter pontiacus]UOA22283.1 putative lipid II flippase MurJ [Sulfitobacter pontiacus]